MSRSIEEEFLSRAVQGPTEKLLLLGCSSDTRVSQDFQKFYSEVGDETAWNVAQEHELEGSLAHKLMDLFGPESIPERWRNAHRATASRIAAYLTEVDRIAALLAEQTIPVVALKNAGIARGVYPCAGCSPMGDVDLLVRRRDYKPVHRTLLEEGFTCDSRNPTEAGTVEQGERSGGTEYHKELPGFGTFWLELQWRPVAGRWLRPDQEPDGDDLMKRSLPIESTHLRLLSAEDNLLQVCLHTAKHSYLRAPGLRLHTDVERLVRHVEIDWIQFVKRVKSLRVCTASYFSLWLPARLLGTPVPEWVLAELAPSEAKQKSLLSLLLRANLFYPNRPKFSNAEYIRFNGLLYDSIGGLMRAIFPDSEWMKSHYQFRSPFLVPFYHARRIADLGLRRVGI